MKSSSVPPVRSPLGAARLTVRWGAVAFCCSLPAATALLAAAPAAADTPSDLAAQMVADINAVRSGLGLVPLTVNAGLAAAANGWSSALAGQVHLSHNPTLVSQAPAGWTSLGENVGVGASLAQLEAAFIASPEHYTNMVDAAYNQIGVGVVVTAPGYLWVTEDFMGSRPAPAVTSVPAAKPVASAVTSVPVAQPVAAAVTSAPVARPVASAVTPGPAPPSTPAAGPALVPGRNSSPTITPSSVPRSTPAARAAVVVPSPGPVTVRSVAPVMTAPSTPLSAANSGGSVKPGTEGAAPSVPTRRDQNVARAEWASRSDTLGVVRVPTRSAASTLALQAERSSGPPGLGGLGALGLAAGSVLLGGPMAADRLAGRQRRRGASRFQGRRTRSSWLESRMSRQGWQQVSLRQA